MLNKKDLINIIADQQGVTKKEAGHIIDAFTSGVKKVMKDNQSVNLVGFGKFESVYKEERTQVLGFSGETVTVPAHYAHKAKLSTNIVK